MPACVNFLKIAFNNEHANFPTQKELSFNQLEVGTNPLINHIPVLNIEMKSNYLTQCQPDTMLYNRPPQISDHVIIFFRSVPLS
jgi:hypothetical protein